MVNLLNKENFKNSIVKIISDNVDFNWFKPYKNLEDYRSSGTGFFIDDIGTILTCFHVISNSIKIWITIPDEGKKKIDVTVISTCPQSDIALLRVNNYKNKGYLKLSKDEYNENKKVFAAGYPLNSDKLKITSGIISGIQGYHIQIDAPINSGNSGGPLIKNCEDCEIEVIGINSSKIVSSVADNIGYAIPINVFNVVKDNMYSKQKIIYKPELLVWFNNSNEYVHELYQTENNCKSGYLITHIDNKSPFLKIGIKANDILCSFDNKKVDNYGECLIDNNERIHIDDILQNYKINDEIIIKYWNSKKRIIKEDKITLDLGNIFSIKKKYPNFENIEYEIIAGMIVMELTVNHIELLKKSNFEYNQIFELARYKEKKNRLENVLIVTHIFSGSYMSSSDIIKAGDIIDKINDIKVNNINQFRKEFTNLYCVNNKKYIVIETKNYKKIIIDIKKIIEDEKFLSDKFNYKKSSLLDSITNKKTKYYISY